MPEVIMRLLNSYKFWATVVGAATVLFAKIGWSVSEETCWQVVTIFSTLVGAQGLKDFGEARIKTIQAAKGDLPK